jgi:hypothetical protein
VNFVAAHFDELAEKEDLLALPLPILCDVLQCDCLHVPGQAWLLSWIQRRLALGDQRDMILLNFVRIENLARAEIIALLEALDPQLLVSVELMIRLRPLLIQQLTSNPWSFSALFEGQVFDGFFEKLTAMHKGNPHALGLVSVEVPPGDGSMSCLLNYHERFNQHWKNDSRMQNNWILFDLKSYRLKLTGYSLRACYCTRLFHCRPKAWKFSGSNDRREWAELDRVTERDGAMEDNPYAVAVRTVAETPEYRYFKWEQLQNWDSQHPHVVHLSAFELFGIAFEPRQK